MSERERRERERGGCVTVGLFVYVCIQFVMITGSVFPRQTVCYLLE